MLFMATKSAFFDQSILHALCVVYYYTQLPNSNQTLMARLSLTILFLAAVGYYIQNTLYTTLCTTVYYSLQRGKATYLIDKKGLVFRNAKVYTSTIYMTVEETRLHGRLSEGSVRTRRVVQ